MLISDAQIHVWAADSPERPWPSWGVPQRPVPLGADEVICEMDAAGVARAVLVPPSWDGDRNDVALSAVVDHPDRFGVMGIVDLRNERSTDMENWLEQPGMLGAWAAFTRDGQKEWLVDGTADWFFAAAARHSIPVMVYAPGQTLAIGEIARRHPGLSLIVDHLNLTKRLRNDEEISAYLEVLCSLSALPNIAVKVSALPCVVAEPYPFVSWRPHVHRVLDSFGPERSMWGSDLSRLPCTYVEWVQAMTDFFDFLPHSEKALVMGRALAHWLNWPESPGLGPNKKH